MALINRPVGVRLRHLLAKKDATWLLWLLAFLALLAVAFILYSPILTDFFVFDDFTWLHAASNPDAAEYFRRAFTFPKQTVFEQTTPFWRPAIDTYFFAGWRVFGLEAEGWHIANLVVHGLNASLLAILVWQLTTSRLTGVLAALLFIVLPTYDIAVSWISSSAELIAAFFYLFSVVLFVAYKQNVRLKRWCYWGAFLSLLLALLSKESAMTLPAALALVSLTVSFPRSREAFATTVREIIPFAALGVAYVSFIYLEQYIGAAERGQYELGSHAFANLWDYLKRLALPLEEGEGSWVVPTQRVAAIVFLCAGGLALALRAKVLGFAFLWAILALVPYLFFPWTAFRYTYLASVPAAIFLVVLMSAGYSQMTARMGVTVRTAVVLVLMLPLVVFLADKARDTQDRFSTQSALYSQLFHEGQQICGELPPRSQIHVVASPLSDSSGNRTRMAFNLAYDDVFVLSMTLDQFNALDQLASLGQLPVLPPGETTSCIVVWDGRSWFGGVSRPALDSP